MISNDLAIKCLLGVATAGFLSVAAFVLFSLVLPAWRRSTPRGRLVFALMSFGAILYAGAKARRMAIALSLAASQLASPVTEQDVERGFRQLSVRTNAEVSVGMPTNAVPVGKWHVRGAYQDRVYVPFGDFDWIAGSNAINRVSVFTGGRARPAPRDALREISAVGGDLLAVQGRSILWYQEVSDARAVGWHDFSLSEDTNVSVNASITWYADGTILAKSNGVEKVYGRVSPGDWDGDGIPNTRDSEPLLYNGDFFGPENVLPMGCNSNAYCTVSVVATGPDAEVRFEGDGPSDYPDPHYIAKSGVTNEVYILIGKAYHVTSDQPIAIVDSSDLATDVWINDSRNMSIIRPVEINSVYETAPLLASDGSPLLPSVGLGFTMSVVPSCLGGRFQWGRGCCSVVGVGQSFTYVSNPDCTCGGCEAAGFYTYEGYRLDVQGPKCCCYFLDGEPHWAQSAAPRASGVSASFSQDVVIFEDRYENTPGEWVEKNSTRTKLTITAWGGPSGSTLTVMGNNLNKLSKVSGADLPYSAVTIPAGMEVTYEVVYEGAAPSGEVNDIVIVATAESEGLATITAEDAMTAVRVTLMAQYTAPENACSNRHIYGVGEKVRLSHLPESFALNWTVDRFPFSNEIVNSGEGSVLVLTYDGRLAPALSAQGNGVVLNIPMELVEPQGIVCQGARWDETCSSKGLAGGFGMVLRLYVLPMTVSFQGVDMMEVPCDDVIPPTGYYTTSAFNGSLTHTIAAGAGIWNHISEGNFWMEDNAWANRRVTPWFDGQLSWKIPIGWFLRFDDESASWPRGTNINACRRIGTDVSFLQVFNIDAYGTIKLSKHANEIVRGTNDVIRLNGTVVHEGCDK